MMKGDFAMGNQSGEKLMGIVAFDSKANPGFGFVIVSKDEEDKLTVYQCMSEGELLNKISSCAKNGMELGHDTKFCMGNIDSFPGVKRDESLMAQAAVDIYRNKYNYLHEKEVFITNLMGEPTDGSFYALTCDGDASVYSQRMYNFAEDIQDKICTTMGIQAKDVKTSKGLAKIETDKSLDGIGIIKYDHMVESNGTYYVTPLVTDDQIKVRIKPFEDNAVSGYELKEFNADEFISEIREAERVKSQMKREKNLQRELPDYDFDSEPQQSELTADVELL